MIVTYVPTDSTTHQVIRFRKDAAVAASQLSSSLGYTKEYGPSASVWLVPGTCPE